MKTVPLFLTNPDSYSRLLRGEEIAVYARATDVRIAFGVSVETAELPSKYDGDVVVGVYGKPGIICSVTQIVDRGDEALTILVTPTYKH